VLDLVEALKWVREHVARFGGDPGNITIFGQSGGGGKVSALLAMPDARRLFHKAIVQSGSSVRFAERERTNRLAEAVLKYFALAKDRIAELQAVPIDKMLEAVTTAQRSLPKPRYPLLDRYNFGPVIDGTVLPQHPFMPNAPSISDDIPVMVGDTKDESAIFLAPDNKVWNRAITEDDLKERIGAVAGAQTDAILAYYKKRDPAASATDRLITALTGSNFGVRTLMQAEAKALRNKAPVYTYRLDWETPAYDGKLKAPHSIDVPFIFDTLHVIGAQHQKPGAQALADRISKTWATFARSGNPSNDLIPAWSAYDTKTRATMVFNDECRVENDPNAEVRPLWRKAAIA
jgi:para-nitrobenzyl esterase